LYSFYYSVITYLLIYLLILPDPLREMTTLWLQWRDSERDSKAGKRGQLTVRWGEKTREDAAG